MDVLIILVPVSIFLSAVALGVFLWTLRSGQYDDLDGDAWRILNEDEDTPEQPAQPSSQKKR